MSEWRLEELNSANRQKLLAIRREDVSTDFVEEISETIEQADYGTEHRLRGHCYGIKAGEDYAGILLIGEGIPWECDPAEIKGVFFYRILGFVIDTRYRGRGIGSWALEQAIAAVCAEYGSAPVVIECHRDNEGAIRFYEKHGFKNMNHRENDDYYFIR